MKLGNWVQVSVVSLCLAACGGGGGGSDSGGSAGGAEPDTTPDTFTFHDIEDAKTGTLIISDAVVIRGINTSTTIEVDGGAFSVNGGAFTESAGTISNNDEVRVRLLSSSDLDAHVSATLTVGGVSDTFDVTTRTDEVAPTAQLLFPIKQDTWITEQTVRLRGTASDNLRVAAVRVNDVPVETADQFHTWEVTLTLGRGKRVPIEIYAEDDDGNEFQEVVNHINVHEEYASVPVQLEQSTGDIISLKPFARFNFESGAFEVERREFPEGFSPMEYDSINRIFYTISDGELKSLHADPAGVVETVAFVGYLDYKTDFYLKESEGRLYVAKPGGSSSEVIVEVLSLSDGTVEKEYTIAPNPKFDSVGPLKMAYESGRFFVTGYYYNSVGAETAPFLKEIDFVNRVDVTISTPSFKYTGLAADLDRNRILAVTFGDRIVAVDVSSGVESILSDDMVGESENLFLRDLIVNKARAELFAWSSDMRQLLKINLQNGAREKLSSADRGDGPELLWSDGSVLDAANNKIIVASGATGGGFAYKLMEVDTDTGNRNIITGPTKGAGNPINNYISDLYLRSNGDILVALADKVLLVDRSSGDRSVLVSNDVGSGVALSKILSMEEAEESNTLWIYDAAQGALISINLLSGDRVSVSGRSGEGFGPEWNGATSFVLDKKNDRALVAGWDNSSVRTLYAVDLATGERTVESAGFKYLVEDMVLNPISRELVIQKDYSLSGKAPEVYSLESQEYKPVEYSGTFDSIYGVATNPASSEIYFTGEDYISEFDQLSGTSVIISQ